ncbi:hypothetical protein V6U79_11880 [Micromonospora sp. CPCC 205556]
MAFFNHSSRLMWLTRVSVRGDEAGAVAAGEESSVGEVLGVTLGPLVALEAAVDVRLGPVPTSLESGDDQAEDLPGTAFRTGIDGLSSGEAQALVEDACTAGDGARVIGPEGDHLNGAWATHEPAHRLRHQRTTNALPPCLLRYDKPVNVVGRGLRREQQPAQETRPRGNSGDRRGPTNVLARSVMEAEILGHWAEPALDLGRQAKEAMEVLLSRKSDDHPSSLTRT